MFLIGPNASGKSNLLDAFRFLHDVAAVGGGMEEAITERGGVSKLRCLAARRKADIVIAVEVGADDGTPHWAYELGITQGRDRRPALTREVVRKHGQQILCRPAGEDRDDPERLRQTYIEQVNVNQEFRDLAEFFRTISYLHLVPQLVRDADRYIGVMEDPHGSDLLERIAATNTRSRTARLHKIGSALEVVVPQLEKLEFFRDEAKGTPHLRARYKHWRPQGAWQTEEQFSDGTLRFLGMLWAVLDGGGPLLLEEPELSLHPHVVRFLPRLFARMQRRTGRQVRAFSHACSHACSAGLAARCC